jgi:hypothetical protein
MCPKIDKYGKETLSISTRSRRCMGCTSEVLHSLNISTRQRPSVVQDTTPSSSLGHDAQEDSNLGFHQLTTQNEIARLCWDLCTDVQSFCYKQVSVFSAN